MGLDRILASRGCMMRDALRGGLNNLLLCVELYRGLHRHLLVIGSF